MRPIIVDQGFGPGARAALDPVLRAVAAGAGPSGRTCLIAGSGRSGSALAIVRALADAPSHSRLPARFLREILFELDRDLGDGTLRLAMLWGGLVTGAAEALAAGVPAARLAASLHILGNDLAAGIEARHGQPPRDAGPLRAVASAAGAPDRLAEAIGETLWAVGREGAVDLRAGRGSSFAVERGEGFVFDAVPAAPAFAQADLEPAYLLVADAVIEDFGTLAPVLDGFATRGKALCVVARAVRGAALQTLLRNHRDGGARAIALTPAAVAQQAVGALEDLAVATGATLVAEREGTSLSHLRPAMLGRCAHLSVASGRAVLRQPAGDATAITARRSLLGLEVERHTFLSLDRERYETRARRLSCRWGRIAIGDDDPGALSHAQRALAAARLGFDGVGPAPAGALRQGLVGRADDPADEAGLAARHAFRLGIGYLDWALSPGRRAPWPPRWREKQDGDGRAVDPVHLTTAILRRATSAAAIVVQAGAIIQG